MIRKFRDLELKSTDREKNWIQGKGKGVGWFFTYILNLCLSFFKNEKLKRRPPHRSLVWWVCSGSSSLQAPCKHQLVQGHFQCTNTALPLSSATKFWKKNRYSIFVIGMCEGRGRCPNWLSFNQIKKCKNKN